MQNIIICNAFSLNMLKDLSVARKVYVQPVSDPVAFLAEEEERGAVVTSAVGHADTAALFAGILQREVPAVRSTVLIDNQTMLLVGQYKGPRLPEGTTVLPEGATVEWVWITSRVM